MQGYKCDGCGEWFGGLPSIYVRVPHGVFMGGFQYKDGEYELHAWHCLALLAGKQPNATVQP